MSKTMNPNGKSNARGEPVANGQQRPGTAAERPPESAEDFAHVLRRLISAKDGRPGSGERSRRSD